MTDDEIEKQYDEKIELFCRGRNLDQLSQKNAEVLRLLREAQMFDPRLSCVYYQSREMAEKAIKIAKKLNSLTNEEFMKSDYPYLWRKELYPSQ